MKRSILLSGILLSLLAACGDEVTEVIQSADDSGMTVVAAGEKLSKCSKENVGEMVFVSDSNAVFFCADGKWKSLNGKDGEVSSSVDTIVVNNQDTLVVRDTLVIKDTISSVDTIYLNRLDTLVLRDTLVGLNGVSCNAEKIAAGYKIVCGGDSVGVVLNGEAGKSCSLQDDGNGVVLLSCGDKENSKTVVLYKAFCEGSIYDPEVKQCVDKGLLSLCKTEGAVEQNTNKSYYTCRDGHWDVATSMEVTVGKACLASSLGEMLTGSDDANYVCREDGWDKAMELEVAIGKSCTGDNQMESLPLAYSNWVCRADSMGWVYDFEHLNRDSVEYAGKTYKTVGIGEQMWFAENLSYADETESPNLIGGNWCYGNDNANCEAYGRLYTWTAAMNLPNAYLSKLAVADGLVEEKHRGICPEGWHVPSKFDWEKLIAFVKGIVNGLSVTNTLKAGSTWKNGNGKDLLGFSAKSSGYRHSSHGYVDFGEDENLWSTLETSTTAVWYADFQYSTTSNDFNVYNSGANGKSNGMTLRCLKD